MKKCIIVLFVSVLSTLAFAEPVTVDVIGKGSTFVLKKDILLTKNGSRDFSDIRAVKISSAVFTRCESCGGRNWTVESYKSMECELLAKPSASTLSIKLNKDIKLSVSKVLSARTDHEHWYRDEPELFQTLLFYGSFFGRDQNPHLFAEIKFNHPAIDKLLCWVPNTESFKVSLSFLKKSIFDSFDINIKSLPVEEYSN